MLMGESQTETVFEITRPQAWLVSCDGQSDFIQISDSYEGFKLPSFEDSVI
jgi:hypothetical protein